MPANLLITRPAFSDADSIPATTFNGVTIVSAIVPDATPGAEGVIRLAGDLTGGASAPVLVATGVAAGVYGAAGLKVTTFTVDAKGRLTAAAERDLPLPDAAAGAKGVVQLAGDLTGTAAAPALVASGVTAGTYGTADQALETVADPAALAALVVAAGDVGRRIVRVTSTGAYWLATTAGSGADKWTLQSTVANGLVSFPVVTLDAKGRATAASVRTVIIPEAGAAAPGLIRLAGDLTGSAQSPALINTGVAAGTYGTAAKVPRVTVDAKGRVTAVVEVDIPTPTALPSAWVQFDGNATAAFRVCAYARAANVVTITDPGHTWRVGDRVSCDFTSGGGVDGLYTVETVAANEWTFTLAGANTGGNVTLEVYQTRNTRNVHSVVKDRRFANASYWVNFQNALGNDTYLVNGNAEHYPSAYISVVCLNTTAGVRAQDAKGCSILVYEPGTGGAFARNVSLIIHGG